MGWSAYDSSGAKIERALSDLPVGTVVGTARTTTPYGWLLCDGSAVSRSTYPELFGAIGTAYGSGNGTTTFNVPNSDGDMILAVSTAEKFGINDGSGIANASVTSAKLAAGASSATFVTSTLPSSPVDGQEIYFQASGAGTGGGTTNSMASIGAVWHFRYNASSQSTYRWEFIGGTRIIDFIGNMESSGANASYVDLATVGPRVKVALAGEYMVTIGAGFKHNTNGGVTYMSYAAGATAASDSEAVVLQYAWNNVTSNNIGLDGERTTIKAIAANSEFVAKYRNNDPVAPASASFDRRFMHVVPVRITG